MPERAKKFQNHRCFQSKLALACAEKRPHRLALTFLDPILGIPNRSLVVLVTLLLIGPYQVNLNYFSFLDNQ